jgi:cysteine-rich repeat protein
MRRLALSSLVLLSACTGEPANPLDSNTTAATESGEEGNGSCGDGIVAADEECDLGSENSDAGQCTTECMIAICGDGHLYEGFEECDDGNANNNDDCITGCLSASCGDGFVQTDVEECDDGNDNEADGCTSACAPGLCGDGVLQEGEQCDDGNDVTTDECPACQLAFCGDGYMQAGVELCDDGNQDSTDACTAPLCEPAACGDGSVYAEMEQCDDGNDVDGDACTNACATAVCGDGIVYDPFEECDDGDRDETDGCDSQCIAGNHPQCLEPYKTLSTADRNTLSPGGSYCDRQDGGNVGDWSGPGWYRFTGAAGTQIPESSPGVEKCGTYGSGWLDDQHPALGEGIIEAAVCFNWKQNNCEFFTPIEVVACEGYYLYNLPDAPLCEQRYCGTDP